MTTPQSFQAYSRPEREADPHALPDLEIFYASKGALTFCDNSDPSPAGWYVRWCPTSEPPIGPFQSAEEALASARDDAAWLGAATEESP